MINKLKQIFMNIIIKVFWTIHKIKKFNFFKNQMKYKMIYTMRYQNFKDKQKTKYKVKKEIQIKL